MKRQVDSISKQKEDEVAAAKHDAEERIKEVQATLDHTRKRLNENMHEASAAFKVGAGVTGRERVLIARVACRRQAHLALLATETMRRPP